MDWCGECRFGRWGEAGNGGLGTVGDWQVGHGKFGIGPFGIGMVGIGLAGLYEKQDCSSDKRSNNFSSKDTKKSCGKYTRYH